jgi:hypothetical protein
MSLDSSLFSAGALVRVRTREEILGTLDGQGRLEDMPFMPEMLRFCGQSFRVAKRAHKTCDFINKTGVRALPRAVHLEGLRCDGSAHGGCQAECTLFWKDAWLEPAGTPSRPAPVPPGQTGVNEAQLQTATQAPGTGPGEPDPAYVCQATLLPEFTQPLSPWNPRQYVEDYRSGNVPSLASFLGRAAYRGFDGLINLGVGLGRPLRWCYDQSQRMRGRRALYPGTPGRVPVGVTTPTRALNLQPGELVRVKDHGAILETLDQYGRNRGLSFSAEMSPYCGRTFRVRGRVNRILNEKTGRMLRMKNECIILDTVVCHAQFNKNMIFCPRATYSYWREIWLERVAPASGPAASSAQPAGATAV